MVSFLSALLSAGRLNSPLWRIDMNRKLFRISRICILLTLAVTFVVGSMHTDPNGRSPFLDNPTTRKVIGSCVLAFGVHLLIFNNFWAQGFLDSRGKLLRRRLGLGTVTYEQHCFWTKVGGVFFAFFGILLLAFS